MTFIHPELQRPLAKPWSPEWDLDHIRSVNDAAFADLVVEHPGAALNVVSVDKLELRIWRPTRSAPTRVIYAIHGGGYTAGRAHYDDVRNAEMATEFSALVISPDYRLAPEHPFPTPPQDCLQGFNWTLENISDLPVYLYGDSAGSGLVETVACWHLDQGGRPLAGLICLEPAIDPLLTEQSFATYSEGPMWSREKAYHSWQAYLDGQDPTVLPRLHNRTHLDDCPPILVFVNPIDPLRDEAITWALGLIDAGARLELHLLPGTYHGALSIPDTFTWRRVQDTIHTFMGVFSSSKTADLHRVSAGAQARSTNG